METLELKRYSSRQGQAIIEYVLLLAIILSISGLLYSGVAQTRDKMWKRIICNVSAPCPGCTAPERADKLFPQAGIGCKK